MCCAATVVTVVCVLFVLVLITLNCVAIVVSCYWFTAVLALSIVVCAFSFLCSLAPLNCWSPVLKGGYL